MSDLDNQIHSFIDNHANNHLPNNLPKSALLPYDPWQAPIDQAAIKKVEQRVIKQLLQALMYEELIEFSYQPDLLATGGLLTFYIHCPTPMHTTHTTTYIAKGYIHQSFDLIKLSTADVVRTVNFDKATKDNHFGNGITDDSVTDECNPDFNNPEFNYINDSKCANNMANTQTATLEMVINDILLNIEGAKLKDGFIKELRQTLVNDIQAISLARQNQQRLVDDMSYDELESELMAGHPYHPCYKSRLGFNLSDNYHYGPEFYQDIKVIWLAVDKNLLAINSTVPQHGKKQDSKNSNEWIKTYIGNKNYAYLTDKLNSIIKDKLLIQNYRLIPVHPWQWHNTLINALQPLLNSQHILCLGSVANTYHAQQSIRTLSLVADNSASNASQKDYLKLAMHLTNTSSTRILAKHTVMNAPIITNWLNQLISDDDVASAMPIAFLGENLGISLDHEKLQAQGYSHPHIYGGLAAIWRENVATYLTDDQKAFPLNGVSYIQANGNKLIDPWLQLHGVENWIKQLINVTTAPLIHLLFAHGVALESHAQNIVLVHENGYPVKILLKDLHDGVRYSPEHLTRPDLAPKLYSLPAVHATLNPGSFIETKDTNGIRDMAVACLFFVAFADIAIFMQTHYHFDEQKFWQLVAECIKTYQQANLQHQSRFELFDVFAKQTRIESLAKRRLFGDDSLPIKFINNPLYDYR